MSADNRQVWANYWAAYRDGAGVPAALAQIDLAQRRCWEDFARTLPRKARVLDIGTGDGIVPTQMRAVRPDLVLVGTDFAPELPDAAGIDMRGGVAMEELGDIGEFAAATSQFAFEYGTREAVANELARTVRPSGRLRMLLHHAEGPFVAHNLPRLEPLRWAMEGCGSLDRARALARARATTDIPTPGFFRDLVVEARRDFAKQPVAENFVDAVLQTLELGRRAPVEEVLEVLDSLEAKAKNELGRIESLVGAACNEVAVAAIAKMLERAGFACGAPATIGTGEGMPPFAWMLEAERIAR